MFKFIEWLDRYREKLYNEYNKSFALKMYADGTHFSRYSTRVIKVGNKCITLLPKYDKDNIYIKYIELYYGNKLLHTYDLQDYCSYFGNVCDVYFTNIYGYYTIDVCIQKDDFLEDFRYDYNIQRYHFSKFVNFTCKCLKGIHAVLNRLYNGFITMRFPFLKMRNWVDDLHYHNMKIDNYVDETLSKLNPTFFIHLIDDEESFKALSDTCTINARYRHTKSKYQPKSYKVCVKDNKIVISDDKKVVAVKELQNGVIIKEAKFAERTMYNTAYTHYDIVCIYETTTECKIDVKSDFSMIGLKVEANADKFKVRLGNIVKWIYENPMQWFHLFPETNWLNSLPYGWRISFGYEMCRKLSRALSYKDIYRYRIRDVKNKFAMLCWYTDGETEETHKIVREYTKKAFTTCVNCGNQHAEYLSVGWVAPYCRNCINDKSNYTKNDYLRE